MLLSSEIYYLCTYYLESYEFRGLYKLMETEVKVVVADDVVPRVGLQVQMKTLDRKTGEHTVVTRTQWGLNQLAYVDDPKDIFQLSLESLLRDMLWHEHQESLWYRGEILKDPHEQDIDRSQS